MHLLIKPVVRLLTRFSWNLKFLIIGLAATCIMAVLVIMASATERATLAATRDEVRGLDVFEPTLTLLVLMQQHRGLASGALGGNATMKDATDKKTAEVDAAFAQVDAVTRAAPAAWELDASLQKLRTQWSSLRDDGMSMSADANFRAHTELVEGLMAQINHLGDESGLILDPESETYHGIIAVMGYMPQVTEQLGKMRGLGSGILAQKHIADEQRIALAGLSGSLRLSYGFLRNALDSAIRHKTHYAATVTTLLDAMDGEINESIMLAESEVMSSNFGVSPQDYFDTVSKPINLLVSTTTQKLLPTLRGELQARETRSQRDLSLELALSILGALLLLGGFAALHRSLREALDALIVGTRALAGGDFRHRITIDTRDEMAALAGHFNDMSIAVSNALGSVIRDTRRVQEAATEMARISAAVRSQAQQQSDSASSIAAAVEETAVSMGEIARHATETEHASSEAQRDAGEGSAQVERVAGGMEHIADVINTSAHSVRVLGERSAEISQLTATIREIADQTNLLALNAAIEAARAGETGRGFAVVADEVRKLAERTSKTSGEIAQMVAAIASGTDEAARALETGVSQVREGVTRSREAGHHMDAIRGSTDRVLGAVSDIGLALREQRTANEEVARNVEAIARMAEAAANEVEQAAGTASRLQGMADELQRSVARFSVA